MIRLLNTCGSEILTRDGNKYEVGKEWTKRVLRNLDALIVLYDSTDLPPDSNDDYIHPLLEYAKYREPPGLRIVLTHGPDVMKKAKVDNVRLVARVCFMEPPDADELIEMCARSEVCHRFSTD